MNQKSTSPNSKRKIKPPQKHDGICYLVGAGPGDPGLLTLRGKECLSRAEVVLYDYLCNKELLRHVPPNAEKIYVGKSAKKHALPQQEINELLVKKTQEGHRVVRLKGGDPFLFGRGGEEAEALAHASLRFEIVPGVTSAIGGLAYAGIPVTHRSNNSQLTIFTGHEDPSKEASSLNYHSLATAPGTKVMLMGVERLSSITHSLIAAGMESTTPVALVRWATTGRHKTITGTLETIASIAQEKQFSAPCIAVFGEVVSLRKKLNWFETRPLFGRCIAVTRTRDKASELVKLLRELGADAFELPTIRIEAIQKKEEREAFAEAVTAAHQYDWIVFTSPNGVTSFFEAFYLHHHDARSLGAARIAAIGPGTAKKIEEYRFSVDLIPPQFVAESLLEELKKVNVENLRILLPRASGARELLAIALEDLGAIVDDVPVYDTLPELNDEGGGLQRFCEEKVDMITFTSGSTAEHFQELLKKRGFPFPANCATASIGPVTSSVMQVLEMPVSVEAEEHDIPGLVEAIAKYFTPKVEI
ncbi:MAG: uroporphyrinogen-III C-methyltransferase [Verrucomicrobia bacterium]|nr:MAG: uroporphyrinogen-III C-methyltransferase [Verrucomicrobiota bacterium]